jgi:L-ascorbate metabolism protein UlaG (beta-lactamase superfamily)
MLERLTWFWQSGYRWAHDDMVVYIDPKNVPQEYEPGDVIFITHAHFDHLSPPDVDRLRKDDTVVVAPRDVANELSGDIVAVGPGDRMDAKGIKGEAVPAYNIAEDRRENHPKDNGWVGYVLELGGHTVYHAGDTDHLPELEGLNANLALLPIGAGGFTMDAHEAAALAVAMSPDVAVPMHYGFVEGCDPPTSAETFRQEAQPVKVEILEPRVPFEFGA